jgi:hypothetical protein
MFGGYRRYSGHGSIGGHRANDRIEFVQTGHRHLLSRNAQIKGVHGQGIGQVGQAIDIAGQHQVGR